MALKRFPETPTILFWISVEPDSMSAIELLSAEPLLRRSGSSSVHSSLPIPAAPSTSPRVMIGMEILFLQIAQPGPLISPARLSFQPDGEASILALSQDKL